MARIFLSHSTDDDAIVRALQQRLGELGHAVWVDSRGLRGGDLLWPEIQHAIEEAGAYAVVVSPAGLQSSWVGRELRHALEVQKQRGERGYPVVPLSLDGTPLGAFEAASARDGWKVILSRCAPTTKPRSARQVAREAIAARDLADGV